MKGEAMWPCGTPFSMLNWVCFKAIDHYCAFPIQKHGFDHFKETLSKVKEF